MTPPSLAAWDEAMYGEGMSRIHASPHRPMTTESQTGQRPTSSIQRFR